MKRLLIVTLLLVTFLFPQTVQAETAKSFSIGNGVSFGMTREEVIEKMGEPGLDNSEYLVYSPWKISQFSGDLVFEMVEGTVSTVMSVINEEHSNYNKYINDFEAIDKALEAKYGEAVAKQEYLWNRSLYKDSMEKWGFAVAIGDVNVLSIWSCETFSITHLLSGDNMQIGHSILYRCEEKGEQSPDTTGL